MGKKFIERFANAVSVNFTKRKHITFYFGDRASWFSWELYRSPETRWLKLGVASPNKHAWWAVTTYIYF